MRAERDPAVDDVLMDLCEQIGPRGVRPSDPETVLAEIGFDSLASADLAAAVEERLGVRLTDSEVAEFRTVGDVAGAIDRELAARPRVHHHLGRSQQRVKALCAGPLRLYTRMRVGGTENVPGTGPVIIAANHRSMLDIPVMVVAAPRPVYFMAKQELFGDRARSRLWLELGGFPVQRKIADIRSVDVALALLERGEAVVVYPEGRRSKTGEMLPFLQGPSWLAFRTGAPLVPCGVIGTGLHPGWNGKGSAWIGKHVRVAFGPPIQVEREVDPRARRDKAEALTGQLLSAIHELLA